MAKTKNQELETKEDEAKLKAVIEMQCSACNGTGIYHGMAEPKGVGVVCLRCQGTGKQTITYIPFTGRKKREDIDVVRLSKGSTILSCGPTGTEISYQDFLNGQVPTP